MPDFAALNVRTPAQVAAARAEAQAERDQQDKAARQAEIKTTIQATVVGRPETRSTMDGSLVVNLRMREDGRTATGTAIWHPATRDEADAVMAPTGLAAYKEGPCDADEPRVRLGGRWIKRTWRKPDGTNGQAWEFKVLGLEAA